MPREERLSISNELRDKADTGKHIWKLSALQSDLNIEPACQRSRVMCGQGHLGSQEQAGHQSSQVVGYMLG